MYLASYNGALGVLNMLKYERGWEEAGHQLVNPHFPCHGLMGDDVSKRLGQGKHQFVVSQLGRLNVDAADASCIQLLF